MTDLRDAARQALEALMWHDETVRTRGDDEAIEALRAALEQPTRAQAMRDAGYARRPTLREMAEPEQEPVAWRWRLRSPTDAPGFAQPWNVTTYYPREQANEIEPLYTAPPQRKPPLTEEEIQSIHDTYHKRMGPQEFARAIEAALKERNA